MRGYGSSMRFHGHAGRGRSHAVVCIALPRDEDGQKTRLRPPIFYVPLGSSQGSAMWTNCMRTLDLSLYRVDGDEGGDIGFGLVYVLTELDV